MTTMNRMDLLERKGDHMSYMSGMMMGMAFGKGVSRLLTGGAAPMIGQGAGRLMGGGASGSDFSEIGDGLLNFFSGSKGKGRGKGRGQGNGQRQETGRDIGGNASDALVLSRSIPGRRRYYAQKLIGSQGLAEALESALAKLSYIEEVKANPRTGSLLLVYQCSEDRIDGLVKEPSRRIFGAAAQDPAKGGEAGGLAALGQGIKSLVGGINRQVKAVTKGLLDLPSLLSLLFTVQGLEKILVSKQLPSGPQMIWWAFSLLRGWRIA